jgi:hypothetical protein
LERGQVEQSAPLGIRFCHTLSHCCATRISTVLFNSHTRYSQKVQQLVMDSL